jgi:hypothetical protein
MQRGSGIKKQDTLIHRTLLLWPKSCLVLKRTLYEPIYWG